MISLIKRLHGTPRAGFSLVEFIVIISIFAIMAGIALFNFSGFSSSVSLNNLAHDIALTVRQAQVYGISASEEGSMGQLSQARGVLFPFMNNAYDSSFIIFLDADTDFSDPINNPFPLIGYNQNTDVELDRVTITTQDRIADIQVGIAPNATSCMQDVIIAFKRPDPSPRIFCSQTAGNFARIIVEPVNGGSQRFVEIWPTGQIAVVPSPTTGGN